MANPDFRLSLEKILDELEAESPKPRAMSRFFGTSTEESSDQDDTPETRHMYRIQNSRLGRALPRMGRNLPRMGRALPRMGRALPRMGRALPRMG